METETRKPEEPTTESAEPKAGAAPGTEQPEEKSKGQPEQQPGEQTAEQPKTESTAPDPLEEAKKTLAQREKEYLYLRAEYDNFRRRSVKEKSEAYANAKADAALKFLPVYDNLERALQQGTEDEAFRKGIEMTMNQLKQVLESLDIHPIDAVGKPFDPKLHNAVMHIEDETLGENVVAQCFQTGFTMGEKVIRFAMVQVAN